MEDFDALQAEATATCGCSNHAFRSLIFGYSYHAELEPLRRQVSGYPTRSEAKEMLALVKAADAIAAEQAAQEAQVQARKVAEQAASKKENELARVIISAGSSPVFARGDLAQQA